ncbi:BON domain-containing protein [Neorhizobium sp. CSC1952]|uniref:BON domain-containing protein n=1 Tax=Neorhizobium sp. CSC1952 TaxID=2978974 RepID=UPI0025A519A1|nr:BON domain-containing protein [Rhizobium sp. CSC1952]WJR65379.1 BON domain-containing protein [Rhizobium sp. CSC1952]
MKNEQPKAGRPGETSQWPRWEGPAESRPSGYLQGEANIFAERPEQEKQIGKAPSDYERPDDLIAEDVNEQLTQDAFLDPTNMSVSVENGEVVLEGYVAQLADKARAEEAVLNVAGVTACRNNLRIAPERH